MKPAVPRAAGDRTTVRCAECRAAGHPLRIIHRSYCGHRTCTAGPCWTAHARTCPPILMATGQRPERAAVPVVQLDLFEAS